MEKILNYSFHDILTLKIIIRRHTAFTPRVIENKFAHYQIHGEIKNPDITVIIGPFEPKIKGSYVVDNRYRVSKNYIFTRRRHKIAAWALEIEGIESGNIVLRIHGNFPAWWVFPGSTLFLIVMLKLAQKGYAMLHASGASRGEKCYIFAGRSGSGKTITVFNLMRKGFHFLGDDTIILGKEGVLNFLKPLNVRFTYDTEKMLGFKFTGRKRIPILLKNMLRVVSRRYLNLFTKINVDDHFKGMIGKGGRLEKIFFMTQGEIFSLRPSKGTATLIRRMLINTRFEAEELSEYCLAYSYVFPGGELGKVWKKIEKIMRDAIENSPAYEVDIPREYSLDDFGAIERCINADG